MRGTWIGVGLAASMAVGSSGQTPRPARGVSLANLSWVEAEPLLTASTVVVIPLGAAAVEQGPHLKLNNGERLARYLASRVEATASVVIAPPLTYHFYPEFLDYPGSTSLTQATARDFTIDIVRSLARSGPRRFYVLNAGVPTLAPLANAAEKLAEDGILLGYTDTHYRLAAAAIDPLQKSVAQPHADEIATSMMLYVDPSAVDMTKARREYGRGSGPLTRRAGAPGLYSPSGISGDPTLATREKGRVLVETLVTGILEDIERVRMAALPSGRATSLSSTAATGSARGIAAATERNCTPQDERTIRQLGPLFSTAWNEMDAERIALMFTEGGDVRHPDGMIERGREVIRENRRELFTRREYRGSVHSLALNDIRCVGPDVALADGKWELRNLGGDRSDSARRPFTGWCTLVVRRASGAWQIEAWRYTIDPPPNTSPAPTILKRPGWPGGH